jgi:hypothetical protein
MGSPVLRSPRIGLAPGSCDEPYGACALHRALGSHATATNTEKRDGACDSPNISCILINALTIVLFVYLVSTKQLLPRMQALVMLIQRGLL